MATELTPTQAEVLRRVENQLEEHFHGFVLIVRAGDAADGDGNELRQVSFRGGYSQAVGMVSLTQHDMLQGRLKSCDD